MEPMFSAKTVLSVESQLEASTGASSRLAKILTYAMLGIVAVLLGTVVYSYIVNRDKKFLFLGLALIIAAAYMVYNQFFAPKRALEKWRSGIEKSYGVSEIHLTTDFYDRILVQSTDISDETVEEGYSGLTAFRETEHLFLLQCKHQRWFFVDKSGFTVGSPDAFRTFMAEKVKK